MSKYFEGVHLYTQYVLTCTILWMHEYVYIIHRKFDENIMSFRYLLAQGPRLLHLESSTIVHNAGRSETTCVILNVCWL